MLHPMLRLKWKGVMASTKIEAQGISNNFDVDRNLVCITLQEPRAGGKRNALFQIQIQVTNMKVNVIFDNGSQ
jgi:hypothetical protein